MDHYYSSLTCPEGLADVFYNVTTTPHLKLPLKGSSYYHFLAGGPQNRRTPFQARVAAPCYKGQTQDEKEVCLYAQEWCWAATLGSFQFLFLLRALSCQRDSEHGPYLTTIFPCQGDWPRCHLLTDNLWTILSKRVSLTALYHCIQLFSSYHLPRVCVCILKKKMIHHSFGIVNSRVHICLVYCCSSTEAHCREQVLNKSLLSKCEMRSFIELTYPILDLSLSALLMSLFIITFKN